MDAFDRLIKCVFAGFVTEYVYFVVATHLPPLD